MTFPFLGAFGPAALMGGILEAGTFTWVGNVTEIGSGSSPSASVNFGAADSSRLVVLSVHWITVSSSRSLSSATIGGVSATIHEQDAHSGGSTGLGAAIISALVPAGTSGTVALNFSGNVVRSCVSAFRATSLVSNTPFDTLAIQGSLDTDISGTIDVPSNGACLIIGTGSTNTTGFHVSFTGASEVFDDDFASGNGTRAGALSTGLSAQSGRTCRYNMGSIPDSGTEMIACTWALNP